MSMNGELKIFSGSANPALAADICRRMRTKLGSCLIDRFSDGELRIKINENVRGTDTFIVQPTFAPADNILELLMLIDAARRASARRITAVIPYFGYSRQERKDQPRVPISAKLVANLIATAGADRVLTLDLHAEAIQGFFDIPVDHLYAMPVIIRHIKRLGLRDLVVVAPDTGGANRARAFAKRLGANIPLAFIDKRRPMANQVEVLNVVGDVAGRHCLIVDDIMDTGRTLTKVAEILKRNGARDVYASATHPMLSGGAVECLNGSCIKQLVVTDTIPLGPEKRLPSIVVLSIAKLLADAIVRIHSERSVSSLFL
ncbi:MAG TPA: ribose-phosphate pyrophosphokinase [candidate division Zixibacteria bacterium]|nr:ribose-phosphate pyrophosphokinase [candidate division Zixibacteria bacterium]